MACLWQDGKNINRRTKVKSGYPTFFTAETLKESRSFKDFYKIFERVFPEGMSLTRENLAKAASEGMNIALFVEVFFDQKDQRNFHIMALENPDFRAYDEALAPTRRAYYEASNQAEDGWDERATQAYNTHQEARASMQKLLDGINAKALADALELP